jgi:hypothetical protein
LLGWEEVAVKRFVLVGLLVAAAANAQSGGGADSQPRAAPENAAPQGVPPPYASPDQPLHLVLEPGLCDAADAPAQWRDASDPRRFASAPLAQFSADGALYPPLSSLVEVRLTLSSFRIFLVGASPPTLGHLALTPGSGWRLEGC